MVRIVYFGTPEFAEPALRRLATEPGFDVALVVCQPDRPAGRGRKLESPPVAVTARELGLPLYQPSSLRTPDSRAPLIAAAADLFVVAAFGMIFGPKTLAIPRHGCVNLHGSLLPAYRGASPIQTAIAMGEQVTGVTLMCMDAGLDTGDIISIVTVPIGPNDTYATMTGSLAKAGAELAARDLPQFLAGRIKPVRQPAGATVTRKLKREDGWIDWSRPAADIEREVRAFWPWPRAWTTIRERSLQVHSADTVEGGSAQPGTILSRKGALVVQCGSGALALTTVQPEGRGAMPGAAFAASVDPGAIFGEMGDPGPREPLIAQVPEPGTGD